MKYRTLRVMLAKGWTRVLYTVSLLLLPAFVHSQDINVGFTYTTSDSIRRTMRVMYGVMRPNDSSDIVPLLVLNNTPCPYDTIAAQTFDFKKNGGDPERIARIIGISAEEIDSINVLEPDLATGIWGARGRNGVISIYTKATRTLVPIPQPDIKLSGIRVVYGPPTVDEEPVSVPAKNLTRSGIRWQKFKNRIHFFFHRK